LFPSAVYTSLLNGEQTQPLEVFDIAGRRCVEPQSLAAALGGALRADGCVQSLLVGEYVLTFAADACVVAIERGGRFFALAQMPRPVSVQFQRLYAPFDDVLQILADYGIAEAEEYDEEIRWSAGFVLNAISNADDKKNHRQEPLREQKSVEQKPIEQKPIEQKSVEQNTPAAKPFKKPTRNLYIIPPGIQRREMDSLPEKSSWNRYSLPSVGVAAQYAVASALASALASVVRAAIKDSVKKAPAASRTSAAAKAFAAPKTSDAVKATTAVKTTAETIKPAPQQQPTKPGVKPVSQPAKTTPPPQKTPAKQPPVKQPPVKQPPAQLPTQQQAVGKKWALDVIVLDAGHGGKDAGTVGIGGTKEKDVTLGVVKKLGALLEEQLPGTKIVYTRKNDSFVELDRRGQIANENGGKLFISIHCNSTPKKPSDANGFEVYILRPGRNEDAVRVAEMENSVIALEKNPKRYQPLTDEQFIVVSMAQSSFVKYSDMAAAMITAEVKKIKELGVRGVNQAGFLVLVGASMPNMLIEIGFLSNKKEEQFLKSYRGQMLIAKAIARAVKAYRIRYEAQIQAQTPVPKAPAANTTTKPVKK
jgi:N-acetylmuramoyl-L-alanine amidase